MNQITTRHIYQIHVKQCAEAYIQKLEQLEIEEKVKNHLITEVKTAVDVYYENIHNVNSKLGIKDTDVNFISTRHKSFTCWLALLLNTKTPATIPLILDAYENGDFGDRFYGYDDNSKTKSFEIDKWSSTQNFIGIIEHDLLKILDNKILNTKGIDPFYNNTKAISDWIQERKSKASSSSYFMIENDAFKDILIETDVLYEEALDFFMILNKTKNKFNEPYMKKHEIKHFIQSNFKFLNTTGLPENYEVLTKLKFNIHIEKQHLTRLVYDFQSFKCKHDFKYKTSYYCMLLLFNFYGNFSEKNLDTLLSNFTRPETKNYPFKKK
jgi:hypothetical protein